MEHTKSGESDVSSGEEPSAKRHRGDPNAPKPTKSVVVLLDSDVTVCENGQVLMPNTIELAKLKKTEKGQYGKMTFTSEMTGEDVLDALCLNFPILRTKRRLSCASAVDNRTKLDFDGERRTWNGALIKKRIRGNSALYLLAEGSCASEESQVLPVGAVPVAAKATRLENVLVANPVQQRQPLPVQVRQKNLHVSAPKQDRPPRKRTAGKSTADLESFLPQSSCTFMSPLRRQENNISVVLGRRGVGKTPLAHTVSGFASSITLTQNLSTLQVRGLASEQSVNEDSMTTPVQHHGQEDLSDETTTWGSHGSIQSMWTSVAQAAQESLKPVSMTSRSKQTKLIAQTSEQGSSLQQVPPIAATAHKNVPAKVFSPQTTSTKKLSVSERKSHPHGHQKFPLILAVSEGETSDSGIYSLLENDSNHDTLQSRDIVHEISPCKGSTKGGDKFHILLRDILPLEIDSCVACFQNCGTVDLQQTVNCFTLTGSTPKSLQGPGPVNVTLMSSDGSWCGGEAVFEYIDDLLTDEEYLNKVVTNKDMRRKLFDRMHKEMSSNEPSEGQTSDLSGKTGPGSSGLNQSRCAWSVNLLQLLVYKAAEIDGREFIQVIFSTSAGKVVFDSYRNSATLPEDVARVNGHSALANYLQDVNSRLLKESNSAAGTEGIDWLELKHAVDKEQSLTSGTDDAQISKKCHPPGYPESDDDDDSDYFADDEISPWSSPSHNNVCDSENEDHSQNLKKSSCEKEANEEDNLPVENSDSSEFSLHLVRNQLEVIPSMKAENSGYEHKQLDSDDVESHNSGDDITEKEYESTVPCRGEGENWDTFESEVVSVIKEPSTGTTSSHTATHEVVVTEGKESGLDGYQKELRIDETSRSRDGVHGIFLNLCRVVKAQRERVLRSFEKIHMHCRLLDQDHSGKTSLMEFRTWVFSGMPTRWQVGKEKKKGETGTLFAIFNQLGGRQGAPIKGTGFLVKDFFPNFEKKHHLVTSEEVIPSDNLEGCSLCLKESDSTDKTTHKLASVVNAADIILRTSGLVFIPLDPGKLSRFGRPRSGLVNHRPFTVYAKGIQHPGCELYCQVLVEYETSHVVKPYQLLQNKNGQHYLCEFPQDYYRKLLGVPITTDVDGEAVAVGALTSRNKVSPVFFSQLSNASTSSGWTVVADGATASAVSQRGKQPRDLAEQCLSYDQGSFQGWTVEDDGATASAVSQRGKHPKDLTEQYLSYDQGSFQGVHAEKSYLATVGIDFGTTYSGFAFSFNKEQGGDSIFMNRYWENEQGHQTSKTPTCLLLKPDRSFDSFGYEAVEKYANLKSVYEEKDFLFFQHFKMALHNEENIDLKAILYDVNGKRAEAKTVFAHSIRFLMDEAVNAIRLQTRDDGFKVDDIQWVLTVPAIWTPRAKQFMREAAYEAGVVSRDRPEQLIIALEPEAAAIFCTERKMDAIHSERLGVSVDGLLSQLNAQYMVVNIGGGTLDVTVHEKQDGGSIKEIHKVTGGPYGGMKVTHQFEGLLDELFGSEKLYEYRKLFPSDWLRLIADFEDKKRGSRALRNEETRIRLPHSFNSSVPKILPHSMKRYGEEVKIYKNQYLCLSSRIMRKQFEPVLEAMKEHLAVLLSKPELSRVKVMLLVGGFAESLLVQEDIKNEFAKRCRVIVPRQAASAVVQGAVMFGKMPGKITERVVAMTYGVACSRDFIEGVHPNEKKFVADGIEKCRDVFSCFVKENEAVKVGQRIRHVFHPMSANDTEMKFGFYMSLTTDPQFVTDPGLAHIGSLKVQSPDTQRGRDREIEVSLYFGGTEITATALDVTSGNVEQTTLDFFCNL